MIILIGVTTAAFVMLVRGLLILIGMYKTPVLRTFEEYGPEERPYLPILPVLLWGGIFVFCGGLWGTAFHGLSFALSITGVLLLICAGLGYTYPEKVAAYQWRILKFPRWYHTLVERTTRYERRRIAYMWLSLSSRLRLTYNSSDTFFFIWADFVIMGTVREEESSDEEAFYTGR